MTAACGKDAADRRDESLTDLGLPREIELKIDELKAVEKRLGSSSERPSDLEQARELAHRINNLLTTYRLGGDLREGGV
jgi:hypothetical protein